MNNKLIKEMKIISDINIEKFLFGNDELEVLNPTSGELKALKEYGYEIEVISANKIKVVNIQKYRNNGNSI